MSYEYTVSIPASKSRLLRSLVKELGGSVSRRKMSPYERAKMEARTGQTKSVSSVDEMFAYLNR